MVPQTVLGPEGGLVEGDAKEAKADPWREGHGGEEAASNEEDAAGAYSSGKLSSGWIVGRFLRAFAHLASSSALSARTLSFSSRYSLSRLRFLRFSISSLN